jgi:hypothetical protein
LSDNIHAHARSGIAPLDLVTIVRMNLANLPQPHLSRRRGMLLLLVLLMLALFLGAGAILLTIALRARAAARANASAVAQGAVGDVLPRVVLDQALMALLRGAASGTSGSVTVSGTNLENLLADKFGSPVSGTGSIASGSASPVMTLSLTGLSVSATTPASRLNGRILTIKPRAGQPGDISSYRILGASGTGANSTCYVARLPSLVTRTLPAGAFDVVINGREFTPVSGTATPEPYDAPDDANLWMAWPGVANNQLSGTFNRVSFCATGSAAHQNGADNDNDGVPDGVWIPGSFVSGTVIPERPSPLGGILRFEVSYLVLDLDGRINVNAAGMADRDRGSYATTPNVPLGMGYGPADVDPSLLFSGSTRQPVMPVGAGTSAFTGAGTASPPGVWPTLLLSGTPELNPVSPSDFQRRRPPVVGPLIGRSGSNALPGVGGDDTQGGQTTTQSLYTTTVSGTNAFADLKARAKVSMAAPATGEVTPRLTYFHPTWSGTSTDAVDDPYEVRLDAGAPRFGMPRRPAPAANQNDDSPFTLAELERILRPGDADAPQLPQRLAAGLEDAAQRARTMITTDSWDTPALTGAAARIVEDFIADTARMPALAYTGTTPWVSGSSTRNVVAAELAAGLRFNINRPVASGSTSAALSEQHEYCKDLYTLVMALSGTSNAVAAAQAAQWAANVLDFRDDDSRITGFEYDTDLTDGWNVDGLLSTTGESGRAVAWGAERPEFVITETAAFNDTSTNSRQLFVTLHRPARNATVSGTSINTSIDIPDATLGGPTIDLGKLAGSSPIWQLRFRPSQAVQFNAVTTSTTQNQVLVSGSTTTNVVGNPTAAVPVASNGYLCVHSASPTQFAMTVPGHAVASGAFEVTVSGTVTLERLADPARANSADNPYVPVDSAAVSVNTIPPATPLTLTTNRRAAPVDLGPNPMAGFWRQQWVANTGTTLGPYSAGTPGAPWFHWPNRPFVSQAELALVASGTTVGRVSTDQVLADFDFRPLSLATSTAAIPIPFGITTTATSGTTTLGQLILEATHVPTRFAGNAVTVTGTAIDPLGFSEPGHNTLTRWREPGRVNVNAIVTGTGTTDAIVWAALSGSGTFANPFMTATTSKPARSIGQLLSLTESLNQSVFMPALPDTDPRGRNAFLAASLPIRLANAATVRSNVFAVWVTVRITDSSASAPAPVTKRLFAIIDRSIPVGYAPGQDLNVRECIRLRRYLD